MTTAAADATVAETERLVQAARAVMDVFGNQLAPLPLSDLAQALLPFGVDVTGEHPKLSSARSCPGCPGTVDEHARYCQAPLNRTAHELIALRVRAANPDATDLEVHQAAFHPGDLVVEPADDDAGGDMPELLGIVVGFDPYRAKLDVLYLDEDGRSTFRAYQDTSQVVPFTGDDPRIADLMHQQPAHMTCAHDDAAAAVDLSL